MSRFLHTRFSALEAYTPGEQPRDKRYIKLNTNESPYPPSPEVLKALTEQDVADLMAQFRSDREISEMLNLSMPYTKKLVGVVKEKMGLEKRGDIRRYLK